MKNNIINLKKPFFRISALIIVTTFFMTLNVYATAHNDKKTIVFQNVNVIDATGAPPQLYMTVIVKGKKITKVGRVDEVDIPNNAEIIDATGKYLIPGLWDMNTQVAKDSFTQSYDDYEKVMFPLFTANGITGIRDMGGRWELLKKWRKKIEEGKLIGPRIIGTSWMLDGPGGFFEGSVVVETEEQGRKLVNQYYNDGVDFIRVQSMMLPNVFYAIMDEAEKLGLPVCGNVPLAMHAIDTVNAGVKSNEFLTGLLIKNMTVPFVAGEYFTWEEQMKIVDTIVAKGQWQVPTHIWTRKFTNPDEFRITNKYADDPRLNYIPDDWIYNHYEPQLDTLLGGRTTEDKIEIKANYYPAMYKLMRVMRDRGVKFLAGTDCPSAYVLPGFSLRDELVLLVNSGLTSMEALQSATSNAAEFLGLDDKLGTIEEGKLADLVLLGDDPTEDITNIHKVESVVTNGKYYSKEGLEELFYQIQKAAGK